MPVIRIRMGRSSSKSCTVIVDPTETPSLRAVRLLTTASRGPFDTRQR